jgi:hypothetical protein
MSEARSNQRGVAPTEELAPSTAIRTQGRAVSSNLRSNGALMAKGISAPKLLSVSIATSCSR